MGKKLSPSELNRICKMLQNAQWHMDDHSHELVTYDSALIAIATVSEGSLQKAAARQFYCDNIEIEYLMSDDKPAIVLHLTFLRDEDDDLESVDTMGVDTDCLLRFFMIKQYIEENKLKVKVGAQVQRDFRRAFTGAIEGLQTVLKSKNLI